MSLVLDGDTIEESRAFAEEERRRKAEEDARLAAIITEQAANAAPGVGIDPNSPTGWSYYGTPVAPDYKPETRYWGSPESTAALPDIGWNTPGSGNASVDTLFNTPAPAPNEGGTGFAGQNWYADPNYTPITPYEPPPQIGVNPRHAHDAGWYNAAGDFVPDSAPSHPFGIGAETNIGADTRSWWGKAQDAVTGAPGAVWDWQNRVNERLAANEPQSFAEAVLPGRGAANYNSLTGKSTSDLPFGVKQLAETAFDPATIAPFGLAGRGPKIIQSVAGPILDAGASPFRRVGTELAVNAAGMAGGEKASEIAAKYTDNPLLVGGAGLAGGLLAGGAVLAAPAAIRAGAKGAKVVGSELTTGRLSSEFGGGSFGTPGKAADNVARVEPAAAHVAVDSPFNLPEIMPGLTTGDRLVNLIKRPFGVPENELATPAMRFQNKAQPIIDSQAKRVGAKVQTLADEAFDFNPKGRIESLPGAPTIQDVAARLPEYTSHLSPAQRQVMAEIRAEVEPYGRILREQGAEFGTRPDIMEGGFYMPRGRADLEGADLPIKVSSGFGKGKAGYRKAAEFDSMMQGIDAGYEYAPLRESIQAYTKRAGQDVIDAHVANYFKGLTDEAGNLLSTTPADRIAPELRTVHDAMQGRIASLTRRVETAEKRAGITVKQTGEIERPLSKLQSGVVDKATAKQVLVDARTQLASARAEALSTARTAGAATVKDQATRARFNLAVVKADRATTRLEEAMAVADRLTPAEVALGRARKAGEVVPTGMGIRLPAIKNIERALKDADAAIAALRRTTMSVASEAASNTTMLRRGLAESAAMSGRTGLRGAEANAINAAKDLAPEQVYTTMRQMDRRIQALRARGDRWSGLADSMQQQLESVKQKYEDFLPKWVAARTKAARPGRNESPINLPGLENRAFPDEIAASANAWLNKQKPLSGAGALPVKVINGFNNLYRGFTATLDNSWVGIQGLLGLGDDPRAFGRAFAGTVKSWTDPNVTGKFLVAFDREAAKNGTLDSRTLVRNGLHLTGEETEFQVGRGLGTRLGKTVGNLPGVKQANRAFGTGGDVLRLGWARDLVEDESARGRTYAEITASGDLKRITEQADRATGWVPGGQFATVGDALLYAPKWLQARIETVYKGGAGIVKGLIPGVDVGLDERIARRTLAKTVGGAVVLTVLANEALGQETDFNPLANGHKNPNFLRIRFAGRDWSLLGAYDSLAGMFIGLGYAGKELGTNDPAKSIGAAMDVFRGSGSGVVRFATDLFGGEDFLGNPTRDTWQQVAQYVTESLLPFNVGEYGSAAKKVGESVANADLSGAIEGAVSGLGSFMGGKSSPVTKYEQRDADVAAAKIQMLGKPEGTYATKYSDLNNKQQDEWDADPAHKKVTYQDNTPFNASQQFVTYDAAKATHEKTLSGLIDKGINAPTLRDQVGELKKANYQASQDILGDPRIQQIFKDNPQKVEDALYGAYWGAPVDQTVDEAGNIQLNFASRDAARNAVLAKVDELPLSEQQRADLKTYIATKNQVGRFTDPKVADAVAKVEDAQKAIEDSGYWGLKDNAFEAAKRQGAFKDAYVVPTTGMSYYDWLDAMVAKATPEYVKQGNNPTVAKTMARSDIMNNYSLVGDFNDWERTNYRDQWIAKHKQEALLLMKWGYVDSFGKDINTWLGKP